MTLSSFFIIFTKIHKKILFIIFFVKIDFFNTF